MGAQVEVAMGQLALGVGGTRRGELGFLSINLQLGASRKRSKPQEREATLPRVDHLSKTYDTAEWSRSR